MFPLQTRWIETEIPYTGNELTSHFIYKNFNIVGNAAVAFAGPAHVKLSEMVDLEDVIKKSPIYSEYMLHFLIEGFEVPLTQMVLIQRLLIALMFEELSLKKVSNDLHRIGDDLFDGEAKLSVSIATATPVSSVIHTGINISSENTPVLTKGLEDYQIVPKLFAEEILQALVFEMESVFKARCKVRGVG